MESWNERDAGHGSSKDVNHWKVQQWFAEDAKDGDNRTLERLELLQKEISLHALQASVGPRNRGRQQCGKDAEDRSVVLASMTVRWIAPVSKCLAEKEPRCVQGKKPYVDTYGITVKWVMDNLIGNVIVFV